MDAAMDLNSPALIQSGAGGGNRTHMG
jgi:hypothetical protein